MALAFVQTAKGTSATGTITWSSSATGANNLVVISVGYSSALTVSSVADSAGNTYGTATQLVVNTNRSVMYYALQGTSSSAGTVVLSGTSAQQHLVMTEFSGNALTSLLDVNSAGSGNVGSAGSVNSFTTTKSNSVAVGAIMAAASGAFTPGGGYSLGGTTPRDAQSYKILSATSTESAPFGTNPNGAWAEVAANFSADTRIGNTLVQSTGTAVLGLGSTSTTWGVNTTTGNLIVVGVSLTNAAVLGTVSAVTDNQGNTYQKAITGTLSSVGDILDVELWYAANITGGAGSVTVSHTIDNCAMYAREYSGYNTLDVTSSASGSSAAPNSGTSSATSVANELVVVATGDDKGASQTWSVAHDFGDMVGTATTITGLSMEDQLLTATGAQTGTLILGAAANWDCLLATFKNVATGVATNQSFTTLLRAGNI